MNRNYLWLLLLLFVMGACNNKNRDSKTEYAAEVTPITLEDIESPNEKSVVNKERNDGSSENRPSQFMSNPAKIIKSGSISIESKKVAHSKKNLDALLKRFNAYYEQESSNNNGNYTTYNLIVRIPANTFDNLLIALENGEDKITERNINAEDVTIKYFDLESRLKSKRAYLDRYQAMVSSAKNVKDLLEIQEQIRLLQEEIDSSEAILRSLSSQVNYSTLNINLFEYQANLPMGSNSFWVQIKDSIIFGWNMIQTFVLGIVGLWPVWIIVAIVIGIIKRIRKNRKYKNEIILNKE